MLQAVDHFVLGIELIGSRIDDRAKAGPFGPLADNMVTGGYVIGTEMLADEPKVDGMAITLSRDGAIIQRETAKYPFGDAISPIIAFARMADDHFGGFKKGMVDHHRIAVAAADRSKEGSHRDQPWRLSAALLHAALAGP